jgi:hypothetical protein
MANEDRRGVLGRVSGKQGVSAWFVRENMHILYSEFLSIEIEFQSISPVRNLLANERKTSTYIL